MRSSHSLRYVMKNRATDETLFVIVFTLIPKEKVDAEEGGSQQSGKDQTEEKKGGDGGDDDLD